MKNKLLSQLYESCKKWKTLVLLGAMLLIGTGQMWATDYLCGDFTNWETNKLTFTNGLIVVNITAGSDHKFKIKYDSNWTGKDSGSITRANNSLTLANSGSGGDISFDADVTGLYLFMLKDGKIEVIYPATFSEETVLFFRMDTWWNNTPCYHYAKFTGTGGTSDATVHLYNVSNTSSSEATGNNDAVFFATIPAGSYSYASFYRGTSAATLSDSYNQLENKIIVNQAKNQFGDIQNDVLSGWTGWSNYTQPSSTGSLVASTTSPTTGSGVTLTPSLTSNTAFNTIKAVEYSVNTGTSGTDWTIVGNTFTPLVAGTYKVTATITYNLKGWTSTTRDVTPDAVTITASSPVDTYAVVGNGSSDFGTAWLGQTDWGTAMTYSLSGTPLSRTFTGCIKSTNDGNQYYNFRILKNSSYQSEDNCDQANSNISLSKNGNNVKFNIRWKADVTISYTPSTKKAAVNVDESSYIADNYYLQGSITGWADGSPGTFTKVGGSLAYIKMTDASANHQFKITNQSAGYEMEMDTSFIANALGDIEIGNNGTNMNIASSGTYYIVIKLPCAETGYRHKVYATQYSPVCTTPTIAWSTAPADGVVGESMTASVTTNQTSPTITWNSSNTSAATVNSSGVISYVAAGITRITASYTGDGSTYCSTTASVYKDITVSAPTYYTVTYGVDASGNGTLAATYTSGGSSIGASPATVLSGSGLTFTADPDDGYEVEGWYTNAACTSDKHDAGSTTYTVASLGGDLDVYVKFKLTEAATWYLIGDGFGDGDGRWQTTNTSFPFNQKYRGLSGVVYREVEGPSNYHFRIHDGSDQYGYTSGTLTLTLDGDAASYVQSSNTFYREISSGTTAWFVINTNTSKIWIMSPLHDIDVTSANGTVTMSATDDYTDQSITGTQFASGETVTITVTPESGYQISSVTFDGTPIAASSTVGYTKTYSETMPSSNTTLVVEYEELQPEWKMYYGSTEIGTFELQANGSYRLAMQLTNENASTLNFKLNGVQYKTTSGNLADGSQHALTQNASNFEWQTSPRNTYYIVTISDDGNDGWQVAAEHAYAVTYNGNGKSSGTVPTTQYYAVGETITTAARGDLGKDYCNFLGWNTANDGSGIHYAESASAGTMTSSGLNLYAEWEDLSSSWVLKGGTNVTGDDWETKHMLLKKPGHTDEDVVYYTASISSTNAGNNESNAYSFKIVKEGDPDTWYGLGSGDGEWWYYRSSGEQTMGTSNKNIQIIADMAGDYEVKVDYTDVSNPKVTVSFPIDGNYNVTLSASSHGSVANEGTLTIHEFPKVAISATPEPGYRFTGWTVDSDHSSYISFDNSSNASTNVWATDAAAAGATITANFSNDGFVYFDRSAVKDTWSGDKVYVTYFTSASLSWDEGEGKTDGLIVKNWINDDVHNQEMTKIPNTSIYYFYTSRTPQGKILFTDKSHAGTDYLLWDMGAAVREDFNIGQDNMFVVENYNVKDKNKVGYCDGYWMKYNEDKAGISLKVYSGGGTSVDVLEDFELEIPGTRQFTATVTLSANTTYSISLLGGNGTWYNNDNSGTMESTNCTSWPFVDRQKTPGHITTTADGTYRFTLNCADKLYLTADYPLAVGDYQVVFNGKVAVGGTTEKYSSSVIRHIGDAGTKKDTLSFFVVNDDSWTMQLQRCTALSPTITWANVGVELDAEDFGSPATGIYNFVVEQDSTAGTPVTPAFATMTPELYTGEYYIRSDAADGGWEAYKRAIDNKMIYSSFSKQHSGFDYYHCKYKGTGTNVKFCIANDYSARLSDTLYTDTHASTGEGVLPYQANIRFMWNSETNVCSRAYLNGSSDGTAEYLKIASDPSKTVCNSGTKANNAGIIDKNGVMMLDNDTTFEDLGNWVYQIDLKALEGGRVKLTSDYRYGGESHNQWFKGKDGDWSDANTEQIMGGDANEYHLLRVIYDFKTNHMLSAWLVDQNENITGTRSVNADVLILRTGHDDAKQITFGTGAELDDVDTIYSAIELRKSHIFGSGSQASKEFYWVSFPYDVKISDIFGSVGNFNIDWAIQYYNGKKRAQNGFWSDSEPTWEFFKSNTETLKANEGYVLTLALRKFLKTGTGSKWDNGVDSLYLYFPSANKIGTILKKDTILKIDTVGYQCTIDRRTDKTTPNIDKDRRVADSHWHCIGIPSFANSTRSTGSSWTTSEGESSSITDEDDIPNIVQWTSPSLLFLYSWNMTTNKLTPVATSTYTFKAMHAYLVQYANDTIHWKAVSRPSKIVARQRTAVQSQEFRLEVRRNGVVEDQTFIHFSDEEGVTAGFEFGRDLSKEFNNNSANIYTFADYVPVAGNSMPLETEQTTVVPMGVKVAANGEYTIAMPEGTNGIGVVLVDNVAGTRTNLGLTDYTINLSAGQYNGRFVLEVSPIMHTPTGIEEIAGDGAQSIGARKVLIDGVMYIVRDGKIFDARGNRVK